jgi:replication factor C small subunit
LKDTVWIEDYRPKSLNDVVGQEQVTKYLKEYVKNKKIPHLLFSGPPGVGKTTCAQALAREIYGKDWRSYYIEMNASDERKLQDIRDKVKRYAETATIGQDYKIIFMDEVDHLDWQAQPPLRTIIEKNSSRCRFILSCNYPNKLIDPLIDRCVTFRFKKIKPKPMQLFIKKVAKEHKIDITDSASYLLATLSDGSMRKALNTLQKIALANVEKINDDVIYDAFCYVDDGFVKNLLTIIDKGDLNKADEYMDALLYDRGYEPKEIIEALRRLIKDSEVLRVSYKVQALKLLGDFAYRIDSGASSDLQLKTYVVCLLDIYRRNEK